MGEQYQTGSIKREKEGVEWTEPNQGNNSELCAHKEENCRILYKLSSMNFQTGSCILH